MKRILLAAIISLGLHGLLFSMETRRIAGINPARPESRQITISLLHQQEKKPTIKPSPKHRLKHIHKKKPQGNQVKPPDIKKNKTVVEQKIFPEPEELEPAREYKQVYFYPASDLPQAIASAPVAQKFKTPDVETILEARPVYRINPPPSYPIIARKRGYQGDVVLEVLIDKQGKVIYLKVFSSSGYSILDKTATACVKKCLFQPGMKGPDKIDMWVRVPIRFRLN